MRWRLVLAVVFCLGRSPLSADANQGSYIYEFPHPRMAVHFHPTLKQFKLSDAESALDLGVHSLELDLHYRESDGDIVCNHDKPTSASPTLRQAIDAVLRKKGTSRTVNHDGRQFFLVLEPKENSGILFDGILRILGRYAEHLSTAVGAGGLPRGITVVITGSYPLQFYAHFPKDQINRLCIVEQHDYAGEIANRSRRQATFNWVSLRHGREGGRVSALHAGTDASLPGRYNVRIWDGHKDIAHCLATGADAVNADLDEIPSVKRMILRGMRPSCAGAPPAH